MNIGINAHLLAFTENYRQAGLSRHIYELLASVPSRRPADRFIAYVPPGDIPPDFRQQMPDNLRLTQSRFPTGKAPVRIPWEQTLLSAATYRDRLDLLHCPVNVRPFVARCPVIVTIHDLIFLRYPKSYHPGKQAYLRIMTCWSARHAAHVIAVSRATRQDAITLLGVPARKITTVFNGVGSQFTVLPGDEVEAFRKEKELSSRTILYIGTLEPRKNLTMLLNAFKALKSNPSFGDVKLIIGGSKGWYYDEIFATAGRLGLTEGDQVRFLGRVPDEELTLWYNVAGVFAYPSLYEGFGLPPLEAMSCGTPVVVSNTSSLPEVVGDAGVLLEPGDTHAWTRALGDLLTNTARVNELEQRGLERAKLFTWQRAATETAQIYGRVLAQNSKEYPGR